MLNDKWPYSMCGNTQYTKTIFGKCEKHWKRCVGNGNDGFIQCNFISNLTYGFTALNIILYTKYFAALRVLQILWQLRIYISSSCTICIVY